MGKIVFSVSDRVEREGVGAVKSSLELFQAIYRNPGFPLPIRMRAAREAIPYEFPRMAVMAMVPDRGNFAEQLEAALDRSSKILELRKVEEPAQPTRMRRL